MLSYDISVTQKWKEIIKLPLQFLFYVALFAAIKEYFLSTAVVKVAKNYSVLAKKK